MLVSTHPLKWVDTMNYEKIYESFISRCRALPRHGYTERHHILPRSLGGDDSPENLIDLSAREHFFAHLLLAKIHGGNMWAALAYMSRGGTKSSKLHKCTSRQYEFIKRKDAEWRSLRYRGDKNPFYGKTHSPQALVKMRKPRVNKERLFGRTVPGVGAIISFVQTYKPRAVEIDTTVRDRIDGWFTVSDELKRLNTFLARSQGQKAINRDHHGKKNPNYGNGQAISGEKNPMFGKKHSESTRAKIAGKMKRTLVCPHCGKESNIANAHRWHFDNCKHK